MQLARVRTRPEVASAVRDALTGVRIAELPVTLRFWDGSVLDGGAPVIEVRDPVAIAHILHAPGQMGLARAWVAGALDVEDVADLEAILRLRSFKVELTPRDIARLFAAAVRIVGPAILKKPPVPSIEAPAPAPRPALARPRQGRDPPPLRRLQRLLRADPRPEHGLLVRVLRRAGRVARGRPGAQARPDLPQAAARARRAAARHRLRLGLAADPRRAALRRAAASA